MRKKEVTAGIHRPIALESHQRYPVPLLGRREHDYCEGPRVHFHVSPFCRIESMRTSWQKPASTHPAHSLAKLKKPAGVNGRAFSISRSGPIAAERASLRAPWPG